MYKSHYTLVYPVHPVLDNDRKREYKYLGRVSSPPASTPPRKIAINGGANVATPLQLL